MSSPTLPASEPASSAALAAELRPRLMRLVHLLRRHSNQMSLTLKQSAVLGSLAAAGPRRMSELAQLEGVQLPTMTQIVSRMEEQGWVERRVLANDRRGVEVVITAEGRRLAAQVLASRTSFIEERLSHLSEAERQALSRAIPALDGMLK